MLDCFWLETAQRLSHPLETFPVRSHLHSVTQKGVRRAISTALTRASNGRSDRQVSAAKDFSRKSRSVDPVFIGARAHPEPGASSCAHQSGRAFRPWRGGSLRKQTVPVIRRLSAAFAGALASRGVPHRSGLAHHREPAFGAFKGPRGSSRRSVPIRRPAPCCARGIRARCRGGAG